LKLIFTSFSIEKSELVNITEVMSTQTGKSLSVVDIFTLIEQISLLTGKNISESLNIVEAIVKQFGTSRDFSDSFSVAESLQKLVGISFSEAFTLAELFSTQTGKGITLLDSFSLAEAEFRNIGKNFLITLSFADSKKVQVEMSRADALSFAESLSSELTQPAQIIYEYILRLS